jgi:primosomal protein N' (replication factor Y)
LRVDANLEMPLAELIEKAGVSASPVNTLEKQGVLEIFEKEFRRDPMSGSATSGAAELTLTGPQTKVLGSITGAIEAGSFKAFLLHGITGSGKTEVYMRAMNRALEMGKSSLMLVPEIALTPVFSKRLRAVFGDEVAILHSSLSRGERYDEWRRIRDGEARIVIGTRSAVFAPLKDLGLVVVDEEHDPSYRQHEMPFYHGRDVAVVRAKMTGAVAVLGSATPALESYYNAKSGKYELLELPDRIGERALATAEIVDLRETFREEGSDPVLAPALRDAIRETHARGEQSIILLNRRGFSQFVLCRSCGETIKCKNCDITLTFHKGIDRLVCHYCNYRLRTPDTCPQCESRFLYFLGEGTEQLEKLLRTEFPGLRIARVDRDSTRKRKQLEKLLHDFSEKKIDMLTGTQMLAKGHDFPNVTLVGVVSVDTGLALPDFRSAERTFQLLTQVAGRAGRGDLPGRVIIQTFHPTHYALLHAKEQSYEAFYEDEIVFRRRLNYPPFTAMASILVKHADIRLAAETAGVLRKAFAAVDPQRKCSTLGPAPAALSRIKGEFRLQILVRSANRPALRKTLDEALKLAAEKGCEMRIIHVEIDPVNLL